MPVKKPLSELSIAEAGALLRAGEVTSTALTEESLSRVASEDPLIHSFILVTKERALADAARADKELKSGMDKGPLHGIPYALKDIYRTAGITTTCHSALLENNVPDEDCVAEQKLRAGGAVLIGKLATHEFAIGGPSFDLPWPPARNPWNLDHITGGSSSGSGAAVAAGFVRMAMGSDTGGSIRGPSFYCGTVGVKPTYGRVSRRGVYPLSYTLDHAGPLTWSVEDAALSMQVVAGFDPQDPGSVDIPVTDFSAGIGQDLSGLKLAYPRHLFATAPGVSPELVVSIDAAVQTLTKQGAKVDEIEFPDFELFSACGRLILSAEAFAVHEADLKVRPEKFGRYSYQRIMTGAGVTAADYIQALRLRRELALTLNNDILAKYDAIVTASGLAPAPRFDSYGPDISPGMTGLQSIMFNVTGNPTLSLPTGFASNGLPLGMQIAGRAFDEATLFRIGAALEAAADWTVTRPRLDMAMAV